jgi:signal transduction histidine kinase/CheY-like chemotaxis protein
MRLSIARSLGLALTLLTIALAVVTGAGVAALYRAREHYEGALARTAGASTAVANLASAGIAEAEVLRDATGPSAPAARAAMRSAFDRAAAMARRLVANDPHSERLLEAQIAEQARARRLAHAGRLQTAQAPGGPLEQTSRLAGELQTRQQTLQQQAARRARSASRNAVTLVVATGIAALLGALALIGALVHSMRRPLDELVDATRDLAAGELERRVRPEGPRELRDLGEAFNAMGEDLAGAQARIEEERHRLAVTIESLGDALLVTEPGSSTIATTNPRAADLVPELAPGDRVDGAASPLPPLKVALDKETVVEHGGRILAVTASPLGTEADGVVWTVRDTTERARLEQAKTDFVATASHELRSPLTSIKGFVELLAHSPEKMTERQREFIDIVLRSTDRLVDLVNDLLDVARIDADNVEISRRPIDVGEAAREVVELMGPRIAAKHQHLRVSIAPELPLAFADPGRIRQIVANLVTNAHMYSEEGGEIEVRVGADGERVEIVVADSGVGLTPDERERVFDRFYRARSATAMSPGTGLGLSIVKSLVELHEGEIELESEPGRGTTFHVFLPTASSDRRVRPPDELDGRRVLIVADDRELAERIEGRLAPLGVAAMIAASGTQATEVLTRHRFDAIVLDILMSKMDGFELLRQTRADPELRDTPIVSLSEFAGRSDPSGAWAATGPIDADELRDVLAAAVRVGRSRVLVVGREDVRAALEPVVDGLAIEHQWATDGAAAAQACGERRFEVAVVDVGIGDPRAALRAIDLRGRRTRRAVILFSDGVAPTPSGIVKLGIEVVPDEDAAYALAQSLRDRTGEPRRGGNGSRRRD